MTSNIGTATAIHVKKLMSTPVLFRMRPIPIRFGGEPTGVPIPPMLAPYATINMVPVAKGQRRASIGPSVSPPRTRIS